MAVIARVRSLLSITSIAYVVTLLAASPILRHNFTHFFSLTSHPLHALALALALTLNLKSLPFVWHVRVLGSMFHQLYFQPEPLPVDALFRPMITSKMYTPIMECDWNGHKSNSSYFSDLDISRARLISALLRKGIRTAGRIPRATNPSANFTGNAASSERPGAEAVKGNFMIALGGVTCNFKKEIKPYQQYEIWTRVLSWDNKWLYLLSHMVKAGIVRPDGWDLQPWKTSNKVHKPSSREAASGDHANGSPMVEPDERAAWQQAIFASSLSKYVVKKGRLTVSPEQVLMACDLLPGRSAEGRDNQRRDLHKPLQWTWEDVESERLRGLELAKHFAALDGANDEFPIAPNVKAKEGSIRALGEFRDIA